MSDETLFGWVHLSDIHFGHGDASHGWDQKMVLERLVQDLPEAMKQGAPRPDAILVTGDIAFSGGGRSPQEYADAEAWLRRVGEAVGLGPERTFLVPGNHDVNRGVDASIGAVVDELRAGTMLFDDSLRRPDVRGILTSRMAKYLQLAARFAPPSAEPELFWVHRLAGRGGLAVRLCGLNTALLSRDDTDEGKLQLGKQQLNLVTLPSAAPGEVVIVLTHHPLRPWLRDGKTAEQWIETSAHLHLSGHVHEAESAEVRRGVGTHIVHIVAGSAHGEKMPEAWVPSSHGYNFAGVVAGADGRLAVRTWPRRWSESSKSFRRDFDAVPDDQRFAEHALRASLPAAASTAAPPAPIRPASVPVRSPSPPVARTVEPRRPVRVFASYAPKDAPAREALSVALSGARRDNTLVLEASRHTGTAPSSVDPALEQAELILLLLSPDYLAWDYGYDVEMAAARARDEAGAAQVLVILLRKTDLVSARRDYKSIASGDREETWLDKLSRLPYARGRDDNNDPRLTDHDGLPIATWDDKDAAWTEVALEIRDVIRALRKKQG